MVGTRHVVSLEGMVHRLAIIMGLFVLVYTLAVSDFLSTVKSLHPATPLQ